jgi:hypothetical protein
MSDLFDTLITIVIVVALIAGARAYQTGDLAAWAFDNFPGLALALYPENAPGAQEARQAALEQAASDVAGTAVDAVADVADAIIPGAGEAVENLSEWAIPDLPDVATVASGVSDTISEAIEPEVVVDERPATELSQPPEPVIPEPLDQKTTSQPTAPMNSARPQPIVVTTYQRYSAAAFTGLCAHVKAAGLSHARIVVSYPDGVNQQFTIYPNQVVSAESRQGCGRGMAFCITADNGQLYGAWTWGDPNALVGMANLLSGYQATYQASVGGGSAGQGGGHGPGS